MATLTINGRHVTDVEGLSLFDAAARVGVRVPTSCVTLGKCKECVVEVTRGADLLSPPTEAERHLSAAAPFRLSCQARIAGRGGTIECHTMRRGQMRIERGGRELPSASGIPFDPGVTREGDRILIDGREIDRRAGPIYGLAMDIGTTTIVLRLIDLDTGALVGDSSFENPQRFGGSDVMSRIHYDTTHPGKLLRRTLAGYLTHAIEEFPIDPRAIYEAVVVGNATMLHLLLGIDPRSIALSPFVATFLEAQDLRAADAGFGIHPEGRVALFPSIGAYVGADIVGDVVATGLAREPEKRLLVDVGTNGEIVCGNDERVVATAAPAGPAFEGGQILCGMRATEGAIEGVVLTNGRIELQVIGGADETPRGLCGSGLIDVVAQLRLTDLLKPNGLFRSDEELAGHPLAAHVRDQGGLRVFAITDEVVLTQLDVRELQSAKGAIATGIEVAMREIGYSAADLDEVLLAGSFGTYINPESARVLGLVPDVPVERIKAVGNTASEGAKMALMSFREREIAVELPGVIEYVELSGTPDFNDMFIANLGFPELGEVHAA